MSNSDSPKVYDADFLSKQRFFKHLQNLKVLDIGCGTGKLAEVLKKTNNQCWGVTFSEDEAIAARKVMEEVFVADLDACEEYPFQESFFDCLVFADILEHLRQPEKSLHKMMRFLKPEGEIIVSLPNVANFKTRTHLLFGNFDYTPYGILDETHVRFYTLKTARKFLEDQGLKISKEEYSFWNWEIPILRHLLPGSKYWSLKNLLTKMRPNLFATQFVFHCQISK